MIRVQREDFDPGAEIERLIAGQTGIGGVVSFTGLVRDLTGDLAGMTLEHYPGMTEAKLAEIEAEAGRRWPLAASLIIHRVGPLKPGDRIVLVVAASPHRDAAFEACRFLIDWLKTKAPFWKSEQTAAGERWVAQRASDDAAAARWDPAADDPAENTAGRTEPAPGRTGPAPDRSKPAMGWEKTAARD